MLSLIYMLLIILVPLLLVVIGVGMAQAHAEEKKKEDHHDDHGGGHHWHFPEGVPAHYIFETKKNPLHDKIQLTAKDPTTGINHPLFKNAKGAKYRAELDSHGNVIYRAEDGTTTSRDKLEPWMGREWKHGGDVKHAKLGNYIVHEVQHLTENLQKDAATQKTDGDPIGRKNTFSALDSTGHMGEAVFGYLSALFSWLPHFHLHDDHGHFHPHAHGAGQHGKEKPSSENNPQGANYRQQPSSPSTSSPWSKDSVDDLMRHGTAFSDIQDKKTYSITMEGKRVSIVDQNMIQHLYEISDNETYWQLKDAKDNGNLADAFRQHWNKLTPLAEVDHKRELWKKYDRPIDEERARYQAEEGARDRDWAFFLQKGDYFKAKKQEKHADSMYKKSVDDLVDKMEFHNKLAFIRGVGKNPNPVPELQKAEHYGKLAIEVLKEANEAKYETAIKELETRVGSLSQRIERYGKPQTLEAYPWNRIEEENLSDLDKQMGELEFDLKGFSEGFSWKNLFKKKEQENTIPKYSQAGQDIVVVPEEVKPSQPVESKRYAELSVVAVNGVPVNRRASNGAPSVRETINRWAKRHGDKILEEDPKEAYSQENTVAMLKQAGAAGRSLRTREQAYVEKQANKEFANSLYQESQQAYALDRQRAVEVNPRLAEESLGFLDRKIQSGKLAPYEKAEALKLRIDDLKTLNRTDEARQSAKQSAEEFYHVAVRAYRLGEQAELNATLQQPSMFSFGKYREEQKAKTERATDVSGFAYTTAARAAIEALNLHREFGAGLSRDEVRTLQDIAKLGNEKGYVEKGGKK